MLPHTAEVAVRLDGRTWPELYRNAARGLLAVLGLKGGAAAAARRERIRLEADTPEDLLVVWLEELVYRAQTRREVLVGARWTAAGPGALEAELSWRALGAAERPRLEVKAATYHGLRVRRRAGAWTATVILDV